MSTSSRKSFSLFSDVFGCSTIDGCAPLEKGSATLLSPTKANPIVDFAVGEEVTCLHDDMEEWYHAKIVGVNSDGTVDVEYMDGEVEINKTSDNIFRGALSMDQVRVGMEVRTGCRDLETNITLPATMSTPNVLDFNLAGLHGKKDLCCVGLFVSNAHLSRHFTKYVGMNEVQMAGSDEFISVLESGDVTKCALVKFCGKVKSKVRMEGIFLRASEAVLQMPFLIAPLIYVPLLNPFALVLCPVTAGRNEEVFPSA